ncbi:beta-1,3-galactosyltransferase 5-like [Agrilus planipennis]|uniref:Hexosyltransferase n=1 Tax=Agrilus planipennis TaxID=224129 RepID=A0A1W4X436_AGRPL|nr:beta-1,3-galactosyltransferase 5-like [Agrilus planipennis]
MVKMLFITFGRQSLQVVLIFVISSSLICISSVKCMAEILAQDAFQLKMLNTNELLSSAGKSILLKSMYEEGQINVKEFDCGNPCRNITLLVMVISSVEHTRNRMVIRLTWGHWTLRKDVMVVFVVGRSSNDSVQLEIKKEQYLYQDVIQGYFVDAYNNLTLKTVFMLEWITVKCPNATFVLKTDDDVFINIPRLLKYLVDQNFTERAIYGKIAKYWKPSRDQRSKHYVSFPEFNGTIYPEFTTGPAYVFPAFLSQELFQASLTHTFFKLEDIFLTGFVAQNLGIKLVNWPEFFNMRLSKLVPCKLQQLISIHEVFEKRQFEAWLKVNDMYVKCN